MTEEAPHYHHPHPYTCYLGHTAVRRPGHKDRQRIDLYYAVDENGVAELVVRYGNARHEQVALLAEVERFIEQSCTGFPGFLDPAFRICRKRYRQWQREKRTCD